MNIHYRDKRKIDPTRGDILGDGTPNDADRVEVGPTPLAFAEWAEAGLELPHLPTMREYRLGRLAEALVKRDYAGLLLTDPLNIRYATDSTNMQIWNMHNPFRAVLVCADGYMVLWDYKNGMFLSAFNPLVREVRTGADLFYFDRGDKVAEAAAVVARDIRGLLEEHVPGNLRLAADKPMLHFAHALEALGLTLFDGEEVAEKARSIKGPDEIRAMRCAMHACERSVGAMETFTRENVPLGDVTEADIWAVMSSENIRRGGEWIETRLLTSGPRTNPWFQEFGGRIVSNNEIVAFDTDLVGTYGICSDISRTWWIGDAPPPQKMVDAMRHGHEHIMTNMEMLRPGVSFTELTHGGHRLDPRYEKLKYGCKMHGGGLCDEWPLICYPDNAVEGAFDYVVEPGMVFCVEALIGEEGGDFMIKLEDQVLITEDGHENLTVYPYDPRLMGQV